MRLRFSLLLICGLLYLSCNNEVVVTAPYQERTLITGILESNKDVQFIRIQKAFAQEGVSPFELALDPTNRFYADNELEVWVERVDNGIVTNRFDFEYIDGDTIGIIREEGLFPVSPNILYRYEGELPATGVYKLYVYNTNNLDTITASASMVGDFNVLFPVPNQFGINVTDTGKIVYAGTYAVNARIYDLVLRMHYSELNPTTGLEEDKFKDWIMFSNILGNNDAGSGTFAFEIRANTFYGFIRDAFQNEPERDREFKRLTYMFYAGGNEMYMLYLNNIANLGLNELYASTQYTNIDGGYGIFSSRHLESVDSVMLSNPSIDMLACDSALQSFGFASSLANPFYPECE